MDTKDDKATRGRPPLGKSRMVTVGIRIEPDEREQLEALAADCGMSLCAYLREVVRRELDRDSGRSRQPSLHVCN